MVPIVAIETRSCMMAEPDDVAARLQEEERLREQVRDAIAALHATREERARLEAIAADLGPTPDGTSAMRQAVKLHVEALRELREAMRAFDALLKSPPE